MAVIPQQFINAVVSIGAKEDKTIWIGTGFIVGKRSIKVEGYYPYLVTNRHIVEDLKKRNKDVFYIKLLEKESKVYKEFPLYLREGTYVCSKEKDIDIAIFFLDGEFFNKKIDDYGLFDIDANSYTSLDFMESGGEEGSLIYMIGYPMGLVEEYSKTPICRMGCIARMDKQELLNYNRFLLDIQNFPGNSGSPIICKGDLYGVDGTKIINRCALIGIVNSYISYRETLVNSQTGEPVEVKSENSGLALANPTECIKNLINEDMKKRGIQ